MEDALIQLLQSFNYPVIRQGSLAPEESYPDTFFTFWNNNELEHSAYNDQTLLVIYDFDVNVYSRNPETVYNLLKQARSLLKKNGWQTPDRGHDLASDEITHTGRGMEVTFLAYEEIEEEND